MQYKAETFKPTSLNQDGFQHNEVFANFRCKQDDGNEVAGHTDVTLGCHVCAHAHYVSNVKLRPRPRPRPRI